MKLIIWTIVLPILTWAKPRKYFSDNPVCGYESCPKIDDNKINVHLVCHSHDDVGWLQTPERYFYNEVQNTLDSVVQGLKQDSKRRYIQVETYFFRKWWLLQDNATREDVKNLVNEGRLEMINSAWSMNDEATTHYQSIIDQFTLGNRFIDDELGVCSRPKIGWHIDTFGHSREQASLFSQMGFDGFFFTRFDYRDNQKRRQAKTTDFLWTGSANLGSDSNIMTSIIYRHYSHPPGFCFDIPCGDAPIIDNEESPDFNLESRVMDFADYIREQHQYYSTNQILITMGDDFQYRGALTNFVNIDKLIRGFQKYNPLVEGKEVNIFYSSPTCYTKAVNDYVINNKMVLDVKLDDFFPHSDSPNIVWSGFFTSRPTSKRFERSSNNLLQIAKQLGAISDMPFNSNLKLADAIGVMQHHDANTGTEKQDVEKEYHRALALGIDDSVSNINKALKTILKSESDLGLIHCPLANISICDASTGDNFNVLVYNPLGRKVQQYLQIPVDHANWLVTDPEGNSIASVSTSPVRDFSYASNYLKEQLKPDVLIFKAELPALGYKVYSLSKKSNAEEKEVVEVQDDKIGFEDTYVTINSKTGFLSSITINGITVEVSQEMLFYKSDFDQSGAYIFRPDSEERNAIPFTNNIVSKAINRDWYFEIQQTFSDWASQVIRLYKDEDFIEFDWNVGPINIDDNKGKEIITRFSTNLNTEEVFYTDSNSRELIRRQKNHRDTFNYTDEEPQAGNYYPITSRVVMKDESQGIEFAIISDRPQGVACLDNGQIEVMIHRATLRDELGEGDHMYEMEYETPLRVRGSHYVTIGKTNPKEGKSAAATQRDIAQRKHLQPWTFYTSQNLKTKTLSFLNEDLPESVHLLTLDKWNDKDGTLLIRLENYLEKSDDLNLSRTVKVDVAKLFNAFTITSLKEVSLNAIVPLEEISRLDWPQIKKDIDEQSPLNIKNRLNRDPKDTNIELAPMQIRTFIATISRN